MLEKHFTIGELLKRRALYTPDLEALVGPTKRINFRDFHLLTNQIAYYLLDLGVRPHDRVALLCTTDVYYSLLYYAAAKIGAITVGLNWRNTPHELEFVLADAEPKILFYDKQYLETVEQCTNAPTQKICVSNKFDFDPVFWQMINQFPPQDIPFKVEADQPLALIYTSGTTGNPKGVIITHRNIYHAAATVSGTLQKGVGDRMIYVTPLSHITGTGMLAYQAQIGCTYVFMPQFQPQQYMKLLANEQITHAFLLPGLLKILFPLFEQSREDFSSLKEIISGGIYVPRHIIDDYYAFGYNITQVYAATEALFISMWKPHMGMQHTHTVGKTFFCDLKIVDPKTNKELPPGEVGEIVVRSEMLFNGYWRNEQETNQVLRDGWYYSGDAGKIVGDGFIQLVGRYKDVIPFSGGESIFPIQVEQVIAELPEVEEVSVVGIKNDLWHELPVACVVLRKNAPLTGRQILDHTHRKLAQYKLRAVVFLDQLPKNANGKVLKDELRKIDINTIK